MRINIWTVSGNWIFLLAVIWSAGCGVHVNPQKVGLPASDGEAVFQIEPGDCSWAEQFAASPCFWLQGIGSACDPEAETGSVTYFAGANRDEQERVCSFELDGQEVSVTQSARTGAITYYIPHVTGDDPDWTSRIEVVNTGVEAARYRLKLFDSKGDPVFDDTFLANGYLNSSKNLGVLAPKAATGLLTTQSGKLIPRMVYTNRTGGGMAQAPLTDITSKRLNFSFANFDQIAWQALAVMNAGDKRVNLTFTAYGDCGLIGTVDMPIYPRGKIIGVATDWFPDIDACDLQRIEVAGDLPCLAGVAVTGNAYNSRLILTPACSIKDLSAGYFFLPHITDRQGCEWRTFLAAENLSSDFGLMEVLLYNSAGGVVKEFDWSVWGESSGYLPVDSFDGTPVCAVIRPKTGKFYLKSIYLSKKGGVAELPLAKNPGDKVNLVYEQLQDVGQWKGLAVMNTSDQRQRMALEAFALGRSMGKTFVNIPAHSSVSDLLAAFFPSLDTRLVARVLVTAPKGVIGFSTTGNRGNLKLLFSPSVP